MLSFIKDDSKKSNAVAQTDESVGVEGQEEQISSEADYLLPAEHGKHLRQSTMILIVLFVVGAVVVWFMIKKISPQALLAAGPSKAEESVDNYVKLVSGMEAEFTSAVDDLMGKFNQFSDVEQVGVRDLTKNPFKTDLAVSPIVNLPSDNEKFIEEAEQKARALQLWSIMESPQGSCCMIDEKILYTGDIVQGFVITHIEEKFVEITTTSDTTENVTFRLNLAQ
ncbi:MAG: hypothetical protein JXA82_02880 [Sedimentisphaerales bacterium]|nr:hypothetical protein [Sedimentisphaerales bacterium]